MSSIDLSKLTNAVKKDGKTVSRCPACSERGGDATGNNLVVFADGKFGCQAAKGDKDHNRQILELVGTAKVGSKVCHAPPIRRIVHPPSTVIKAVGRLGRQLPSAPPVEDAKTDSIETTAVVQSEIEVAHAPTKSRPQRPPDPPIDATADEACADVPAPSSPPKVPQAVVQALKHLKWLPDGKVVDTTQLDADGNPAFVDWHRTARLADSNDSEPVVASEKERDLDKETEELLASQGYEMLPDGTIIDPTRIPGYRAVGWCKVPPP